MGYESGNNTNVRWGAGVLLTVAANVFEPHVLMWMFGKERNYVQRNL